MDMTREGLIGQDEGGLIGRSEGGQPSSLAP